MPLTDSPPDSNPTPSNPFQRHKRVARRVLLTLLLALVIMALGCNTLTTALVDREDRRVARNEDGIMLGAVDRTLGNPESPNTVLFVHGYAGAGDNFNRLPQQFADAGWYVRIMRLPGHGTSPRDMEKVTPAELQEAVLREVSELKSKHTRVVLVGHSMGGALSTLAASKYPVDGLILGGAYFGITQRWFYGLKPETWTRLSSKLTRWVYKGHLFLQINDDSQKPHITSYTWLPSKAGITLLELGNLASNPATLERVTCPVLMFHAPGDIAASPEAAEQAFSRISSESKELVWLENSNHHVFWDFDHEILEQAVADFAQKIAEKAPETFQPAGV